MHRTKSKGDVGVAQVIARLTELGWSVGIPLTEHAPYDLFAEKDGVVHTVQVRYATPTRNAIRVTLSASWADKSGNHRRGRTKGRFSVLAVYAPGEGVFFLPEKSIGDNCREITLRLAPALNGQRKHVRNVACYREL
jgi:hypothetical protein